MLLLLQIIFSSVTETVVEDYNLPLINIPLSEIRNAEPYNETYILRGSEGEDSLLTFQEYNKNEEWSAAFKFTIPSLEFTERAYINFWYTDQSFKDGEFYGHQGLFEGILFGLELNHNSAELVLSLNNDRDYVNYEDLALREYLKLKDLYGTITFKLIYTKKNMKLEIYCDDKLVYDSLRFYDTAELHFIGSNKLFSVTTRYQNVNYDKHFVLTDFKLYARAESQEYDARSVENIYAHEIDNELEHSISNVEFFLGYLKYVIGSPTGSTIIQALILLNQEIKKEKEKIEQLKTVFDPKNIKLNEISQKIIEMDIQMQNMIRVMNELKYFLLDFEKSQMNNSNWIIIAVGVFLVILLVYSILPEKKLKNQ